MSTGIGGHHRGFRGKTDSWCTPPLILEALGHFDDDPCPVDGTGGLDREWNGRVFMNPPYGPQTGDWLEKLVEHGNGIALIFARTETEMFFRWGWDRATAMLFLRGRLTFHFPNGGKAPYNSGGPSVLIAYGEANARSLEHSKLGGKLIWLQPMVNR